MNHKRSNTKEKAKHSHQNAHQHVSSSNINENGYHIETFVSYIDIDTGGSGVQSKILCCASHPMHNIQCRVLHLSALFQGRQTTGTHIFAWRGLSLLAKLITTCLHYRQCNRQNNHITKFNMAKDTAEQSWLTKTLTKHIRFLNTESDSPSIKHKMWQEVSDIF